jgi:hypothetical protein
MDEDNLSIFGLLVESEENVLRGVLQEPEDAILQGAVEPIREVVSRDYALLENKPSIEGVPLVGNKTFPQLNMKSLTNSEIENLLTL